MLEVEVHVVDILSTTNITEPKQIIQYFIRISKLWAHWHQDHMVCNMSSSTKMFKVTNMIWPFLAT